jgi:DNA anti-recombination protein RmuC
LLQGKVSAVNRAGGAFSSLNEKRDVSNQTHDVSNENRDFSNQKRDVGNQTRDVSNQTHDVSNQMRDVSNQTRDVSNNDSLFQHKKRRYHREWFEKAMLDYLKIAFLFISFLQYI